jgi:hypothetical protein
MLKQFNPDPDPEPGPNREPLDSFEILCLIFIVAVFGFLGYQIVKSLI